jgi:hypothetical protein
MKQDVAGPLSRSPRSLNRFVNVYRLMKVVRTEWADDGRLHEEQLVTIRAARDGDRPAQRHTCRHHRRPPRPAPRVGHSAGRRRRVRDDPGSRRHPLLQDAEQRAASRTDPDRAHHPAQDPTPGPRSRPGRGRRREPVRQRRTRSAATDERVLRELRRLDGWLEEHGAWAARDVTDWDEVISQISRYSYRLERA